MNREDLISDEQLNAFTDGELEADEENRIFTLAEESAELDKRLCQHRKLKEMVQHAYRDVPKPHRRDPHGGPRSSLLSLAAAAILLLAVGVAGGWFVSRSTGGGEIAPIATAATSQETWLLHVSSSNPERMQIALQRARELMEDPAASPARRVEIVANEGGLDLLRSDVTPFGDQIRQLAREDVLFFACSRAVERLRERGVDVRLVPEADTRYTALDRVVLRLQEGWAYEKI
jgi:intracellular sulfur oxidation DsrE/DsrF family protein